MSEIPVRFFAAHPDAKVPTYGSEEAAGFDLVAVQGGHIGAGSRLLVPTGLIVDLPVGYELQVRPRSGLAVKHGITVLNSPGTVDSDYRGELAVLLLNTSREGYTVKAGDRVGQGVIAPVSRASFEQVLSPEDLRPTGRGTGGWGSTGK